MINYEGTRPEPLPSQHYNKLEWVRNDIEDLVVLDEEGELTADPMEFFVGILDEIVEQICKTDDQRICAKYTNHNLSDEQLPGSLREAKAVSIAKSLDMMQVRLHPNTRHNMLRHLPVLQQFKSHLCGFHAYFNAKCLVAAILSKSQYDKMIHLINL